ncbi:MAG: hypothetical protein WCL51_14040 [Bacteroidota bacterium]
METKFIIGNSYTIREIHEDGFINITVNSVGMSYRKAKTFLTFSIPKSRKNMKYKLISIGTNDF